MDTVQPLLEKYWSGNITAGEYNLLMKLLVEKKHDHIEDCEINSFHEDHNKMPSIRNAEELLQRIHLKIQLQEENNKKKSPVVQILFNKIKWAAAILVFFFFSKNLIDRQTIVTDHLLPVAATKAKAIIQSINNTTDKIKHVQLEDGSAVTLYPESSLSFSDSFNIRNRTITLRGKAFFKVAKDLHKPFSVQVNNIVTTALGTHFMVDGREENKDIRVRLLEGKVVVQNIGKENSMKPVYLLPGQVCSIEPDKMKVVVKQWKELKIAPSKPASNIPVIVTQEKLSSLNFERTLLADVFKTIGKVYDIKIEYDAAEEKKQSSFTGNFSPTASPELLLKIICKTNDLSCEKRENIYFISNLK